MATLLPVILPDLRFQEFLKLLKLILSWGLQLNFFPTLVEWID